MGDEVCHCWFHQNMSWYPWDYVEHLIRNVFGHTENHELNRRCVTYT